MIEKRLIAQRSSTGLVFVVGFLPSKGDRNWPRALIQLLPWIYTWDKLHRRADIWICIGVLVACPCRNTQNL